MVSSGSSAVGSSCGIAGVSGTMGTEVDEIVVEVGSEIVLATGWCPGSM